MRFELMTFCTQNRRATSALRPECPKRESNPRLKDFQSNALATELPGQMRVMRIELIPLAWKANNLPLIYTREIKSN